MAGVRHGRGPKNARCAVLDWPQPMSICLPAGGKPESESDMTPEERQMLAGLFERISAKWRSSARRAGRGVHQRCCSRCAVRALRSRPDGARSAASPGGGRAEDSRARGCRAPGGEQHQEQGSFLGNLGKSIFGGGAPAAPPRPGLRRFGLSDADRARRRGRPIRPRRLSSRLMRSPQPGPWSAPAAARRRLLAERRVDCGGRRRRRRARQSARRPVRRPFRQRPIRRRVSPAGAFPAGAARQSNFESAPDSHGPGRVRPERAGRCRLSRRLARSTTDRAAAHDDV